MISLLKSVVVVKLWNIVVKHARKITVKNIRHFVRPYQLWQSKSIEKTRNGHRHLSAICRAGKCASDTSCWAEVYSEVSFKWS